MSNGAHDVVDKLRRNFSRLQAKTRDLFNIVCQENCGPVGERVCVGCSDVSGGFVQVITTITVFKMGVNVVPGIEFRFLRYIFKQSEVIQFNRNVRDFVEG